jgi:hypothetical protein
MSETFAWWLRRVLPFVRHRLLHALGIPLGAADTLAEVLLVRWGKLAVGRTHVDMTMALNDISIAVRRAGLDLDPGWVPDLGRIVLLRYE